MKHLISILFIVFGMLFFQQNPIHKNNQGNKPIQDSTKVKSVLKNTKKTNKKNELIKQKLDSLSKIDVEFLFDKFDSIPDNFSEESLPFKQNGIVSYYADKFNGRKTASGQIFNNNKFTAAHKTLPFGTILRVTNEANGKSIEVIVNDRGPFTKGRELDLSKAAYLAITRDIKHGTLRATIEIIE